MEKSLFDSLSPEQLQSLLKGGSLQDEGSLLQQQLSELLGSGMQHQEHSTPLGAGLGGIAEALDGTANAFHAKALRGDQRKNFAAQDALKMEFAKNLGGPKDPAAEWAEPYFPRREGDPSDPPMVSDMAGPHVMDSMPGMDGPHVMEGMGKQRNPASTPGLGMDLSQPTDPMHGGAFPEMDLTDGRAAAPTPTPGLGMDLTGDPENTYSPTPTKPNPLPVDQTQIVNNGSDGWGMDLSHPGQVEAMLKALRKSPPVSPGMDISKLPEVADASLPDPKKLRRPFSY